MHRPVPDSFEARKIKFPMAYSSTLVSLMGPKINTASYTTGIKDEVFVPGLGSLKLPEIHQVEIGSKIITISSITAHPNVYVTVARSVITRRYGSVSVSAGVYFPPDQVLAGVCPLFISLLHNVDLSETDNLTLTDQDVGMLTHVIVTNDNVNACNALLKCLPNIRSEDAQNLAAPALAHMLLLSGPNLDLLCLYGLPSGLAWKWVQWSCAISGGLEGLLQIIIRLARALTNCLRATSDSVTTQEIDACLESMTSVTSVIIQHL